MLPFRNIDKSDVKAKADRLYRLARFGEYIRKLRTKHGLSLAELGNALNVSGNYISQLERGVKEPSDQMIREITDFFGVDESRVFIMLNRTPLLAREEVDENKTLQQTLSEIRLNKKLTDDQKQELYNEIHKVYRQFIDSLDDD